MTPVFALPRGEHEPSDQKLSEHLTGLRRLPVKEALPVREALAEIRAETDRVE